MPPQVLFAAALLLAAAKGVEITRLSMPRWVQNGTEDSVVLDCEYNYSEQDDKRLVVKWFLNDDPQPIYQWIPELGLRAASPRLQGRLNMDYAVSPSSQHTRYRALNIMRPTTDLSGRYSCHVVSMFSQDAEDQVMVVYAPPRSFDFNFTKMSSEVVNFTCEADGVFPLPKITLLQLDLEESSPPNLVSGVKTVVHSHGAGGAYHVQVSREIRDRDLTNREPIVFECILSIPGTDYENQKKLYYYPDIEEDEVDSEAENSEEETEWNVQTTARFEEMKPATSKSTKDEKPCRRMWSKEEKNAVETHLGRYIIRRKLPGADVIRQCISSETALRNRNWRNVKDFCRNKILSLNKD